MRLAGRRILVTGAASGIGLAVARLFAGEGARLALLDLRRPEDDGERRADGSGDALAVACDVARADQVEDAVATAAAHLGALDGIVNAAGVDLVCDFESMQPRDWERVMAVNLTGPMLVCRAALPHLAGPATIVNVASAAALAPLDRRAAYCASKAGLVMLTKALALELAPRAVRCNAVCPGVIDTPMLRASYEKAPDPDAAYRAIVGRNAMRRVGAADDIARAVLYLSAADSGFVTGTTLTVDGGRAFH